MSSLRIVFHNMQCFIIEFKFINLFVINVLNLNEEVLRYNLEFNTYCIAEYIPTTVSFFFMLYIQYIIMLIANYNYI